MDSEIEQRPWYKSFYARILLAWALVASLANIFYSIYNYSWTAGDESWHYSYSERYYDTGETERESVHNYNSTTPVILLNVWAEKTYQNYTGSKDFNKIAARLFQVMWFVLLVLGIGVVAFYLGGGGVAWWAVFLLLLDPNLNSHSALIGSDIPFVSMSVWVLLSIFIYLKKPNIQRAALLGALYGLAFCTKYSATFYAVPIILALITVFIRICLNKDSNPIALESRHSRVRKLAYLVGHAIIIVLVVTLIVNLAYSFAGTGKPMIGKVWYSSLFQFFLHTFGKIPLPWPQPFLTGFDQQLVAERTRSWNVVLLGQLFPNGIWYYFFITWVTKTTLGVVGLTLTCMFLFPAVLKNWRNFKSTWVIVGLTWIILFSYFSFIFRTQVGMRYSYPCLPLAYLMIAGFISTKWNRKTQSTVAFVIFAIAAVEVVPYFGNGISFTNSIIANKNNAYGWLADSNIDWFHNYTAAHEEIREAVGEYKDNPIHILPGNNVFTLNRLAGVMHNFDQYEWVRANLKPLKHFQHTHLLYYVSHQKFDNFINDQRTYSELPNSRTICGPEYKYRDVKEFPAPVLRGDGAWFNRLYSGCLDVSEESLFEVRLKKGAAIVGNYEAEHDCQGLQGYSGSSFWFKFKPGMHAICAMVKDDAQLEWIQYSGKAKFALRAK